MFVIRYMAIYGKVGSVYRRRRGFKKGRRNLYNIFNRRIKAITPELKHVDNYNAGSISSAATVNYLTNIPIGDDDNTRDGNEIKVMKITGRWEVIVGDTTNLVRIMIIRDRNPNGVAPTEGEIFETGTNPFSPINSAYMRRFKVVMDKFVSVSAAGPQAKSGRFTFNCPLGITEYIGTGSTVASAGVNAYFLVRQSDSGGVPNPSVNVYTRTHYRE